MSSPPSVDKADKDKNDVDALLRVIKNAAAAALSTKKHVNSACTIPTQPTSGSSGSSGSIQLNANSTPTPPPHPGGIPSTVAASSSSSASRAHISQPVQQHQRSASNFNPLALAPPAAASPARPASSSMSSAAPLRSSSTTQSSSAGTPLAAASAPSAANISSISSVSASSSSAASSSSNLVIGDFLLIQVKWKLNAYELRLSPLETISSLKTKLHLLTHVPTNYQRLHLKHHKEKKLFDQEKLSQFVAQHKDGRTHIKFVMIGIDENEIKQIRQKRQSQMQANANLNGNANANHTATNATGTSQPKSSPSVPHTLVSYPSAPADLATTSSSASASNTSAATSTNAPSPSPSPSPSPVKSSTLAISITPAASSSSAPSSHVTSLTPSASANSLSLSLHGHATPPQRPSTASPDPGADDFLIDEVFDDLEIDFTYAIDDMSVANDTKHRIKLQKALLKTQVNFINPLRASKKLLVLDIDYTIFDMKTRSDNFKLLKRPYTHRFLATIFPYYEIVIWSQTSWRWVELKLTELGLLTHNDYKVLFVLDKCSMFRVKKPNEDGSIRKHHVKPLEVIWSKVPAFHRGNTIHVDDLARNFAMNPQNGLKISVWKDASLNKEKDKELMHLANYLLSIAKLDDWSHLDHAKWKASIPNNPAANNTNNPNGTAEQTSSAAAAFVAGGSSSPILPIAQLSKSEQKTRLKEQEK